MTTHGSGMVLPPHERVDGVVQADSWTDVRVPARISSGSMSDPRVAGHIHRTDECPDGRHLFDVIETVQEQWVGEDDQEELECRFRARLTCVRCGTLLVWQGTRAGEREHYGQLQAAPMAQGPFLAQQTSPAQQGWLGGRDMSTWTIYRDGARVGLIGYGNGPRGRAYHVGRLDAWPDGETVEGKDPAGAFRALAKHDARISANCEAWV